MTGATGETGATGATGPSPIPSYGYVFNTGAQTVNAGADVIFSTNGPLVGGVAHVAGTAAITVTVAGDYLNQYEVTTGLQGGNQPTAYAVVVNGTVQASTVYGDQTNGANFANTLVGSSILTIPAGATLTLRNVGASADILPTVIDGATIVNASIRLVKVS
ncbi:collagen-like protein [Paenibacillus whitsoniae]|uniref:collagen-like protein n=1 Tax=Paenibacillus whitsoniae TaxID=2496558 RepID=UPI001F4974FA|nr:collagen-like protein [Paenibacillus whitsoniae]